MPITAGILKIETMKPNTAPNSPPCPNIRIKIPKIIRYLVNLFIAI